MSRAVIVLVLASCVACSGPASTPTPVPTRAETALGVDALYRALLETPFDASWVPATLTARAPEDYSLEPADRRDGVEKAVMVVFNGPDYEDRTDYWIFPTPEQARVAEQNAHIPTDPQRSRLTGREPSAVEGARCLHWNSGLKDAPEATFGGTACSIRIANVSIGGVTFKQTSAERGDRALSETLLRGALMHFEAAKRKLQRPS